LTLLVQLFSPRRWESIFTLCIGCLQIGQYRQRYALNDVAQTVFSRVKGVEPQNDLERRAVSFLLVNGRSKAGTIQRELASQGVRLNDHETDEFLRRTESKGLVTREEVDWTERIISETRWASGRKCPNCGNGVVTSLYAQMRRNDITKKESKRVVGSFCPSCRSYQLDGNGKGLLERFVLKGKEAG
jgi:hypothetical protein